MTEHIPSVDPQDLFLGFVAGFEAEPEGVRVLLQTNRASMVSTADGKYYFSSKQKGSFRMIPNREVWIAQRHCALKLKPLPTPFSSNGFFVVRSEQKLENPGFETNVAAVVVVPSANPEIAVVEPNMEAVRCVLQGKTKARPTWKHLQAEPCSDRDTVEQGGAAQKTAKPGTPNRPDPTQWPWLAGVVVLLLVAGGILFKVLRR